MDTPGVNPVTLQTAAESPKSQSKLIIFIVAIIIMFIIVAGLAYFFVSQKQIIQKIINPNSTQQNNTQNISLETKSQNSISQNQNKKGSQNSSQNSISQGTKSTYLIDTTNSSVYNYGAFYVIGAKIKEVKPHSLGSELIIESDEDLPGLIITPTTLLTSRTEGDVKTITSKDLAPNQNIIITIAYSEKDDQWRLSRISLLTNPDSANQEF